MLSTKHANPFYISLLSTLRVLSPLYFTLGVIFKAGNPLWTGDCSKDRQRIRPTAELLRDSPVCARVRLGLGWGWVRAHTPVGLMTRRHNDVDPFQLLTLRNDVRKPRIGQASCDVEWIRLHFYISHVHICQTKLHYLTNTVRVLTWLACLSPYWTGFVWHSFHLAWLGSADKYCENSRSHNASQDQLFSFWSLTCFLIYSIVCWLLLMQ